MSDEAVTREERLAREIAAAGHVARDEAGFTVYCGGLDTTANRVWEDPHAGIRCTCERFAAAFSRAEELECEHLLAVALSSSPPEEAVVEEAPPAVLRRVV